MPFDGSGNFTRSYNFVQDKTNGIKIVASRMDGEFDNFATAMNQAFLRNGLVPMTGSLNMGTNTINSIGDGTVGTPALRFNSDPTTGIYVPGYGKVALTAGGTKRLEANSTGVDVTGLMNANGGIAIPSGNGVRSTATNGSLDVSGGNAFNTGGASIALRGSTAAFNVYGMEFYAGGTERARLDTNGGFYVGSSGGDYSLNWQGLYRKDQNADTNFGIINATAGASAVARMIMITGTGNSFTRKALYDNAGAPYHLNEHGLAVTSERWTFGGTEYMRISSAGNVGIGSTSPDRKLTIVAGDSTAAIRLAHTSAASEAVMSFDPGNNGFGARDVQIRGGNNGSNQTYMDFYTSNAAAPAFAMRIASTGAVGIGTNVPQARAEIRTVSAGTTTDALCISNYASGVNTGVALHFDPNGAGSLARTASIRSVQSTVGNYADLRYFIANGGAVAEVARMDVSGNLSVGTTGGDFGRSMRLGLRQDQNAITQMAIINGTIGAGAGAQISKIGGTGNSYVDWILRDAAGAPYDQWEYGSAVGSARWAFGGAERMRIGSTGDLTVSNNGTFNGSLITLNSSKWLAQHDGSNAYVRANTGSMYLGAGGSNYFQIDTSGRLLEVATGSEMGYKDLPQNAQGGAYTLVLADRGKHVFCTGAAAAVTIPPNSSVAFPVGSACTIINDGSGARTITQGAGVSLKWAGTGTVGNRTLAIGGMATLVKVGTDTWYVSGSGLS